MALNYGIGAALLVKHILEGHSIDDSIEWLCKHPKTPAMVVESIQKVDAEITAGTSDRDAVKKFGASCKSDGAFESSIFFLKTSETYTKAIQANILAGGDNCSRSMFIGAAYAGSMGIPAEWKDKSKNYIKVAALLER
jgi:ADP-ribosylglycohydrolase